jgi:hypothetical protein
MWPPLVLPLLLSIVFGMHVRTLQGFLDFQLHYTPFPADATVRWLVAHGASRPFLHDPHVIAYLALPLFFLAARALHWCAVDRHPRASKVAFATTVIGTVYLGGLFGMWTAFYSGLSHVDASQVEGAIATFAAMTAPQGAFQLTTTLAKLAFIGLALQGALLWNRDLRSRIASIAIALGSVLFLAFWDLDNWMLVGSLLLLTGFGALARADRPGR